MNGRRWGIGSKLRSMLVRFRRDRRGASAIEFGLIAVPFLGLLAAIIETGFVFLNSTGLEAAVGDAARNIMTGEAQGARNTNGSVKVTDGNGFRDTYICVDKAVRILPSMIDCSKLMVDVRTASSFAAADTSRTFYQNTYARKYCPGAPQDIVIVRVAYLMPVYLPIIAGVPTTTITAGLVNDGTGLKHVLVGTAVFRNEPYDAGSYTKPSGC